MDATLPLSILFLAFVLLALIVSCLVMFKFTRDVRMINEGKRRDSHCDTEAKEESIKTASVTVLFIITIMTYLFFSALFLIVVYNQDNVQQYIWLVSTTNILYSFQSYVVLWSWFNRVHGSFKDSALALSKWTLVTMYVLIIGGALLSTGLIIHFYPTPSDLIKVLLFFFYVSLVLATSIIFVVKLIKVYRMYQGVHAQADDKIIHLITKIIILNFVSVWMMSINLLLLVSFTPQDIAEFFWSKIYIVFYSLITSCFVSFSSVTLSYQLYASHYDKLCGWIHGWCHRHWSKCIQNKRNDEIRISEVVSNESPSGPSPTTTPSSPMQVTV